MSAYEYESFKVGSLTVRIVTEEDSGHADPRNPRNADNVGVMVLAGKDYELGDEPYAKYIPEHGEVANTMRYLDGHAHRFYRNPRGILSRWLRRFYGATVVLPLYVFDGGSSGLSVTAGTQDDTEACAGFIFDTERTRDMAGVSPEQVEEALRCEVAEYDAWAQGQVCGWVVEQTRTCDLGHQHVEVLDSCWGYVVVDYRRDMEYIRGDARAAAHLLASGHTVVGDHDSGKGTA